MAIRNDKNRFMITLPNELYDKVNCNADTNKRNISNEIEYILENHYNSKNPTVDDLKELILQAIDFNMDVNLLEGFISNISSLYDNQKDKSNLLMIISLILQNKELNDKLIYMFKYLSDNYTFKKD